jgi:HlyD family secretion protein
MDIARPDEKRKKRIRRTIYISVGLVVVVGIGLGLSRLTPAAPSVDKETAFPDTVKRGSMLRDVRGLGTLVPETIWTVPAATDGRIEKRYLLPGTPVKADTVILDMSNPTLEQQTLDAEYQLKGAQATLEQTKATLQNQLMDKRTTAASISSQYRTAEMQKESNEALGQAGLKDALSVKTSEVQAEELEKQNDLAQKEVATFEASIGAQTAVAQATVDQKQALYNLNKAQLDRLHIKPGVDGVLQELDVDVGQQVPAGTVLLKVAQPTQLKAALQIAETQAKDILIGHVIRIDPAVLNGTRTVDVKLDGALPPGAVPQLSVEGTIEIERLTDVLYVGRPVHGDENSTVGLFKADGPWTDAKEAKRVQVQLGKASVNYVQVLSGLNVGDTVILSDMSAEDNYDRVELK